MGVSLPVGSSTDFPGLLAYAALCLQVVSQDSESPLSGTIQLKWNMSWQKDCVELFRTPFEADRASMTNPAARIPHPCLDYSIVLRA